MKEKQNAGAVLARVLAAAALLAVLLALVPNGAVNAAGTEYIVKYKASCAWLAEDGAPFEVVTEAEMKRLRALGLLEWYEPDGEAALMDGLFDAEAQWNLGMIGAQKVYQEGDRIQLCEGPLTGMSGTITKVDRRYQRMQITFMFDGIERKVWTGYDIVAKPENENKNSGTLTDSK